MDGAFEFGPPFKLSSYNLFVVHDQLESTVMVWKLCLGSAYTIFVVRIDPSHRPGSIDGICRREGIRNNKNILNFYSQ